MAFDISEVNHWDETVSGSVLEQYRESPKWQAILKAVIDRLNDVDDAAVEFQELLDFTSDATGKRLDWLSGLVGIIRRSGESDSSLLQRFKFRIENSRTGTPDFIIDSLEINSGVENPVYFDESPATYFIYSKNGKVPTITELRRLSPAGVLGLPGVPLKLANGKSLVTSDTGSIILVVSSKN